MDCERLQKRFVRLPTVYIKPVTTKIKIPPINIARFNSRLLFTVIKRTTNWGCANTPIPTPRIILVTRIHHHVELNEGKAVQPACPFAVRLSGTRFAMFVSASCAAVTPPSLL